MRLALILGLSIRCGVVLFSSDMERQLEILA